VREQVLGVQAWTLDLTLFKVSSGRSKHLENGHSFLLQIM
jgi:hypothetical protein